MRIDSHHHLWRYQASQFDWIPENMSALRRDFLLAEYDMQRQAAAVDGSVVVQARQSMEETFWLLDLAHGSAMLGVVGWAPIASPKLPGLLEELQQFPLLKGLRHIVQAEPDGFLLSSEFNLGLRQMEGTGLVYDLLVHARQLPQAIPFITHHPNQVFVLDHLGKPPIAQGELASWSSNLRDLARRPNVFCKLSGLVTEAQPSAWTPQHLFPYFEVALEAFGAGRMMIGTDWPVCTLECSYRDWWSMVEDWVAPLGPVERANILGDTATQVYKLHPPSPSPDSVAAPTPRKAPTA